MKHFRLTVTVAVAMVVAIFISYQAGYHNAVAGMPGPVSNAAGPQPSAGSDAAQRTFWEAWQLLQREFYNKDALDPQKMTYGAIKGMLDTLGDSHTTFVDPTHARVSHDDMRGAFEGIGVTVETKNQRLTIVAPIDDSPGARAGLRPGDVIAKVDGKDIGNMSLLEAVSLIRGPRGTTVHLEIDRPGEPIALKFDIIRDEIKMVSVKGQMMDGDVAYVKITQFSEPTAALLQQKLKDLQSQGAKAMILDLRNNPGGLLASAVDVASQFIAEGVVLYEQRRDSPMEAFYSKGGGLAIDLPVVVLINKGSASASEIVAGALQDRERAVLVGEASYGKDSVQNVHQLTDHSSLRVTTAKWFTPSKQEIVAKGLTPNITILLSEEDIKEGRDPQLKRALLRAQTGE